MTTVELLQRARKRIERPERWTRCAYGRDETGHGCSTEMAVSWCAAGALIAESRVANNMPAAEHFGAAIPFLRAAMRGDVPGFNDTHTHAEVLAAFDHAIALAESERQ